MKVYQLIHVIPEESYVTAKCAADYFSSLETAKQFAETVEGYQLNWLVDDPEMSDLVYTDDEVWQIETIELDTAFKNLLFGRLFAMNYQESDE